jgi:phage tail-like protein
MGQNIPVSWHLEMNFRVKTTGLDYAYFTTCTEPKGTATVVEIFEGGQRHPHKVPGPVKYDDITLTRPANENADLFNLWRDTYNAGTATGLEPVNLKRIFEIEQLNQAREVVLRYVLYDAFISSYAGGGFNAESDKARMETVTITYERFDRQPA